MNGETILSVKNLKVELNGEKILENLSFEVKEGDVLTILGPNGAGKTVLLKALMGITSATGKIEWRQGVKIGYVPQRLPFIKDIPLNVEEFFKLKDVPDKKIKEISNSIGLKEDMMAKKIGDLSSGQFQRVLIAWAMVLEPQVLLFDEPTTGIDVGGQESVYELLEKLRKKRKLTILLVTHDLSVVYKLATLCLCLNKKMLCYNVPKELTQKHLSKLYGGEVKFFQHSH